jgi:4-aminobutyrate aminotransferase-like enzyme
LPSIYDFKKQLQSASIAGKCAGNALICAMAREETQLKILEDQLRQHLKGIGNSLRNARRELETLSAKLTEL